MKTLLAAFIALCTISATPALASDQTQDQDAVQKQEQQQQQHTADDVVKLEKFLDDAKAQAEGSWAPNYYWHCEAYPSNDPHHHDVHHGYGYNQSQAYWQAMRACNYYHHYCHAHCHVDHR